MIRRFALGEQLLAAAADTFDFGGIPSEIHNIIIVVGVKYSVNQCYNNHQH